MNEIKGWGEKTTLVLICKLLNVTHYYFVNNAVSNTEVKFLHLRICVGHLVYVGHE